jgi:hypothetical protein
MAVESCRRIAVCGDRRSSKLGPKLESGAGIGFYCAGPCGAVLNCGLIALTKFEKKLKLTPVTSVYQLEPWPSESP